MSGPDEVDLVDRLQLFFEAYTSDRLADQYANALFDATVSGDDEWIERTGDLIENIAVQLEQLRRIRDLVFPDALLDFAAYWNQCGFDPLFVGDEPPPKRHRHLRSVE